MAELSILTTTKKLLGIEEGYHQFDQDIIVYINNAFFTLMQLGVGPSMGFSISDETASWESFFGDRKDLEVVKTYVYLKVRLAFDPPQTSYLIDAIKNQCSELEWRMNVQVENNTKEEER